MTVNRREFLTRLTLATAGVKVLPRTVFAEGGSFSARAARSQKQKAYGSGYFGEWMEDEFGLPAFRYTCDQINDPKAVTKVNPGVLSSTDHVHQVGNDRITAIVSNHGHVRVRQDEGSPKFLNDYAPERGSYGAGFGYLTDGASFISTFYPGNAKTFERTFGVGYFSKKVAGGDWEVDQVVFAPFGDDPVLISQVAITNRGASESRVRWVEHWGCQVYEFSFRSFMEMFSGKNFSQLRRELGDRFQHSFRKLDDGSGLVETKTFLGRAETEQKQWQNLVTFLGAHPNPFLAAPEKDVVKEASFDDLNPRQTFLVSLDAAPDAFGTNGKEFFGSGGTAHPSGLDHPLNNDLETTGPESAMLLERRLVLKPGESRTLRFLYGYLPQGADLSGLIKKYRGADKTLEQSSGQWKGKGLRFSTETEPWVEREMAWDHYYVRSSLSYDSFFQQHILSQGSVYQYVMGFQGAARDPLQHVLPFIFSDPEIVKDILRYTLKEVRRDGSIPYGIVGNGMPMPTVSDNSSDMPMWLLWAVGEYVLATRDAGFLDEQVTTYPVYGPEAGKDSVRNLLARCYRHLVGDVSTGEHGVMRMLHDDWNDALVSEWVPEKNLNECLDKGESVLNSAMASYVLDRYSELLRYAGGKPSATEPIRSEAEKHRKAVRNQWTGRWFRRAWLGPTLGWLGEKGLWLEPQPWAIIGGAASPDQTRQLVQAVDELLRRPSPIGAIQLNKSADMAQHGFSAPGTAVNGGIWPSLNATLIWALAAIDGEMAWDEWKKNSFARHAEVYPEVWYQTWSGPDTINSVNCPEPGKTTGGAPFAWTDFPVMNLHSHACQLYSTVKLLGLEFTERGLTLAPKLPLKSYRFESPLVGLLKSDRGYEGWYEPLMGEGVWTIRLVLSEEEAKALRTFEINGVRTTVKRSGEGIPIQGRGGRGKPLRWTAS